jgi:hypothetical protein
VGSKAGLDVLAKRKLLAIAENQTPVNQQVVNQFVNYPGSHQSGRQAQLYARVSISFSNINCLQTISPCGVTARQTDMPSSQEFAL